MANGIREGRGGCTASLLLFALPDRPETLFEPPPADHGRAYSLPRRGLRLEVVQNKMLRFRMPRHPKEKNWMPFSYSQAGTESLFAIHSLAPKHIVVSIDPKSGESTPVYIHDSPVLRIDAPRLVKLRGGAPPVHLPELASYLGVAHATSYGRVYSHFFFLFEDEPPFAITSASAQFCLSHAGGAAALSVHSAPHWNESVREGECERVQFVAGMATENSTHIRFSYGLGDCESRMLSLPLDFVLGLTNAA
jgi:hypothetical protein